jgi:hypothetical protein
MDAGRELDALVAERVMGWRKRVSADHTNSPIKALRDFGVIYAWKDRAGKEMGLDVPAYSTDIAAAWQVVVHIHNSITNKADDGKRRDLNYLTLSVLSRYGATAASFDLDELPTDWFEDIDAYPFAARGDTAAHAICLAALRTVLK